MKHQNKYWILPVLLMIFSIPVASQQNIYNWRVGLTSGLMNYSGDIKTAFIPATFDDPMFDKLSYSFEIERNLSRSFGLQASFLYGTLTANDIKYKSDGSIDISTSNYERALNFQSDIRGGSLRLVYHFDNNKLQSWNAKISPYLFAGIGITRFDVFADLMNNNGDFYYYWSDHTIRDLPESPGNASVSNIINQDGIYETKLNNLGTENDDPHPDQVMNIPLGIGLKYRISERFNLNLQFDAKYAFSDRIDDIAGKYRTSYTSLFQEYAANPGASPEVYRGNANGNNDVYFFGSIGVHINFGEKKKEFKVYPYYSDHGLITRKEDAKKEILEEKMKEFPASDNMMKFEVIDTIDGKIVHKKMIMKKDSLQIDSASMKKIVIKKSIQKGDSLFVEEKKFFMPADSLLFDSLLTESEKMKFISGVADTVEFFDQDLELNMMMDEEEPAIVVEKKISIGSRDSLVVIRFKGMDEGEIEIDPMIFKQSVGLSDSLVELKGMIDQLRMEMNLMKQGITKDTSKIKRVTPVPSVKDSLVIKKVITTPVKDTVKTEKPVPDSLKKPVKIIQQDTIKSVKRDTVKVVLKDSLLINENIKLKKQIEELRTKNSEMQLRTQGEVSGKRDTGSVITRDTSVMNENIRMRKQLDELRVKNLALEKSASKISAAPKRDTVVIVKEIPMPMDRQQADEALQNRIRMQDDRIRMLEGDLRDVKSQQNQLPVQPNINITPASENAGQERLRNQIDAMKLEIASLKASKLDTAAKDSIRITDTGDTIRIIKAVPVYQELIKAEKLKELEMKSATQQTRIDSLLNVVQKEKELSKKGSGSKDSLAIASLKAEMETLKEQLKKSADKKPDVKPQEMNQKQPAQALEKTVVYFASNSYRVSQSYYAGLKKIADEFKKDNRISIVLSAYTDASGEANYNLVLAGKRADAVKNILVGQGVNVNKITIKSVGEKEAEENHDPDSRRVEVNFSKVVE